MLEKLGGNDRDDLRNDRLDGRDLTMTRTAQRLVRERMEAHGVARKRPCAWC